MTAVNPQNLDSTFRAQRILGTGVRVHNAAVYLNACLVPSIYSIRPSDQGILQEFVVSVRFVPID